MSINMKFSNKDTKETISNQKDFGGVKISKFSEFLINWIQYKTKKISDSMEEGKKLWINIKIPIPIYFIEWNWWSRKWTYVKEKNIILIFSNADYDVLKHEIIHSIEYNKPIPNELEKFYELVKLKVSEESFDEEIVSFNFKKNIHEFIADGYSKQYFINALKKEWLYEIFLKKTKYIFE